MERAVWLKKMRQQAEALYDYLSPRYWVDFGLYPNETHRAYLQEFLRRVPPGSTLLSAACGAGRYDGMLLEAGHGVVGIDQSADMLARAKELFPQARYEKLGLQEIDFCEAFDGVICMDAMEHVCPEDWPAILQRFHQALKLGGVLYFTLDVAPADELAQAYERARGLGLPVVFGEVADQVIAVDASLMAQGPSALPRELADAAVYHYYPALDQVRTWLEQAGLMIESEGFGNGYHHFLVRKV